MDQTRIKRYRDAVLHLTSMQDDIRAHSNADPVTRAYMARSADRAQVAVKSTRNAIPSWSAFHRSA